MIWRIQYIYLTARIQATVKDTMTSGQEDVVVNLKCRIASRLSTYIRKTLSIEIWIIMLKISEIHKNFTYLAEFAQLRQ